MPRILVLMLVALSLAACGGGGGGGRNNGGGGGGGTTNSPPVVTSTTFQATQDTDLSASLTATDADSDAVTFTKTGDPAHGTIVSLGTNGAFVYRPTASYKGADSFTIQASDPTHNVAATINITVAALNHAPVVTNDIFEVTGTTPLVDVLLNDTDPDSGDTLTITLNGTPTVGTAAVVSGKVQLTLPAQFKGVTQFSYHAADAGGLGSDAIAVVFVDTPAIRLVYQTNEQNGAQNLYVDDLTGPRAVTSYTSGAATFLGHNYVSADGRTIVWEEASGDLNANYHPQAIWTVPTNGSSAPRQISPALQTNESLNVRSSLSADGKWIVYGVTSAVGVETLYMANLLPSGTSTAIPVPAGALRIESALQAMLFGPTSQYLYFTATTDLGGSVLGQATYRIPVASPAVPTMLSTAAVADRKAVVRLISSDDADVVQASVNGAAMPEIEHIHAATPGVETVISHTFNVGDTVVRIAANDSLTAVAYVVANTAGTSFDLYSATTANAASGALVENIPTDAANTPPSIIAVSATGDAALVSTLRSLPGTVEELRETQLASGGPSTQYQLNPPGFNVYGYIDNFTSIAYTANPGVAVAPRGDPSHRQILFDRATDAYEFSADNAMFAAITSATDSSPRHLFLVNRADTSKRAITGNIVAGSTTLSVRVVPSN